MKEEKSIKSLVLRVLFIVAIVIVVVILAFAIIKVIPYALSSFASMGNMFSSSSKNEIKISASNANLLDGERFLLSWNHRTDKIGEYKLTYKCIENFKISAVTENGIQTILCNTRYSLPNNKNNIELEVQLDKINSFSDVSLEILFIETQTQNIEAKGNLTITVRNDSNIPIGENAATNITTEPITENQVNNQNQATSNQQSSQISPAPQIRLADLAISNPVILNNRTIQFSISNIGGTSVGNWFFTYSIPGQRVEMSPVQPPLLPGQGIRYTLNFDSSVRGVSVINVDPLNTIPEITKSNNILSVNIAGGSTINNPPISNISKADLEISNLEVGRMSGSRFIESNSITRNQEAAVRFIVKNIGNRDSGSWRFEILNSPYQDEEEYRSSRQNSLRPGESKEIIVRFNRPEIGRYNIEVEIDSDDDVDEINENNNFDSITLRVTN